MNEYIAFLKKFIADQKGLELDNILEDEDIFEMNYLDSLSFFTLMVAIEAHFKIKLNSENISDDRIRNIRGIAQIMSERQ